MKTKTLLIIAAIAAAAYILFFRKKDETPTTTTQTTEEADTDDCGTENSTDTEKHTPVITTRTWTQRCPYCGTYGAKIIRTYTDGKVTKTIVQCGNKSCRGARAKIVPNSTKIGTSTGNTLQ